LILDFGPPAVLEKEKRRKGDSTHMPMNPKDFSKAPAGERVRRSVPVFALSGEASSGTSIGWVGQCEGWQLSGSASAEERDEASRTIQNLRPRWQAARFRSSPGHSAEVPSFALSESKRRKWLAHWSVNAKGGSFAGSASAEQRD